MRPSWPSWPELGGWSGVWDAPRDREQEAERERRSVTGRVELFAGPLDGRYPRFPGAAGGEPVGRLEFPSGPGGRYPNGRSLYVRDPQRPGVYRWAGDLP